MSFLADSRMYVRFAVGLRRFLRERLQPGDAQRIIAERLASREANFLRLVERGIYGHPSSPYLKLLRLARVELEDIRGLVRSCGLEGTLASLRAAGVWVPFEAFKGRAPIVVNGHVLDVAPHDFDNPFMRGHYEVRSSGSTGGAGTRVTHDLDHLADWSPGYRIGLQAHGLIGTPSVFWRPVLPAAAGISGVLSWARLGMPVLKWFTPVTAGDMKAAARFRVATNAIVRLSNVFGARLPLPENAPLDEALRVARYVVKVRDTHGACIFRSSVSMALRACLAATEDGLDLSGVTVLGGAEPPTPAKVAGIVASGARFVPTYVFSEGGPIGWGCANPSGVNDLHFFEDMLALVQSPRTIPGTDVVVETFHFTSLMPAAPKLLLNVEIDDFGRVERRKCGCAFEACGLGRHLSGVQSFSKLNGEGVTLVGSQMVHILEHVLPGRFGGSPLDYQLVEDETDRGLTRLSLVVHPRVALPDERAPVRVLLDALRADDAAGALAQAIWAQAGTIEVTRAAPYVSAAGKQSPLRVIRRSAS